MHEGRADLGEGKMMHSILVRDAVLIFFLQLLGFCYFSGYECVRDHPLLRPLEGGAALDAHMIHFIHLVGWVASVEKVRGVLIIIFRLGSFLVWLGCRHGLVWGWELVEAASQLV